MKKSMDAYKNLTHNIHTIYKKKNFFHFVPTEKNYSRKLFTFYDGKQTRKINRYQNTDWGSIKHNLYIVQIWNSIKDMESE